jgi:hypothetical protein
MSRSTADVDASADIVKREGGLEVSLAMKLPGNFAAPHGLFISVNNPDIVWATAIASIAPPFPPKASAPRA